MIYLFIKIFICTLIITLFYRHVKSYALKVSGKIAILMKLTRLYSFEVSKGVVELPLIVCLHFIFCIIVCKLSGVHYSNLGLIQPTNPLLLFEGMLLGIGVMGAASLLGRTYIELMRYLFPTKYPADIRHWLAMARGGWIRHHFHTLEVLPVPMALLITLGQVCAEEIVFRGVLINYFMIYGKYTALAISTILFMYMQIFHMPNRISSAFPVIGALVLGVVGGVLYIQSHMLLPLIIAHITFFAAAVL